MCNSIKLLFVFIAASVFIPSFSQDYIATPRTRLPGIVYLNDSETISGQIAYNHSYLFLLTREGEQEIRYKADDIKGFSLEEGGGAFISVPHGKKEKIRFFENLSPKHMKLYLLKYASGIEERNQPKSDNSLKDNTNYYIYSTEEKKIVATSITELATYIQPHCGGISNAILEYKDKNYYFGIMATDYEIREKYNLVISKYTYQDCEYKPRDY